MRQEYKKPKSKKKKPSAIFSKRKYTKWFKRSMKRNIIPTRFLSRGKNPKMAESKIQEYNIIKFKAAQKSVDEIYAWYGI